MRRGQVILFFLVIVSFCILMASCAKKEAPATPFAKLIGKWKKAKYATDDNNDGVIENTEINLQPSTIDDELFFKSDGTGNETTTINKEPQSPLSFHWQLINGDSVKVEYKANDTITYYLYGISSVDLTLTTYIQQNLVWYYYLKQ